MKAVKYLSKFPRPVLDDLLRGKWLPVIGAGMSRNALVSTGSIPLWRDLSESIAQDLPGFEPTGPIDAISGFEHEFGRPKLIERLSSLLRIEDARPGQAHRAFCAMPFDLVCTTNFDFLLERQYEATPRYCRPLIDEEQLSVNAQESGAVALLKLHGDLHHPTRLVATEADYDGFLARFPLIATYLSNLLITRTAVLIGYSLDDPDFRQIWQVVTERLGRTTRLAYAITVGARASDVSRFERRGVKVVNLPGARSRYGEVLAMAFDELREFMLDNLISVSQVTEEQPLRELSLPRDSANRLCFFAVPITLQSFYRDRVFPVVRDAGFVPLTADDVVSPGDAVFAKIEGLMSRSAVVVVDAASPWTASELRLALAYARERHGSASGEGRGWNLHVIVVSEPDGLPSDLGAVRVIQRPDVLKGEIEPFLEMLGGLLREIERDLEPQISNEPERLLAAQEYRAAVIAAVTLLESTLRRELGKARSVEGFVPLRRLLEVAEERGLMGSGMSRKATRWLIVRNEAVHSDARVSRAAAREVVAGIRQIVQGAEKGVRAGDSRA